MLKFHMPQAIVKPRKTLGSELTVLILAQRYAVRVAVSVTACGMTVQILHSVKAPGFATRNVAFDGAAMGLEMLPGHDQLYMLKELFMAKTYVSSHRRKKVFGH